MKILPPKPRIVVIYLVKPVPVSLLDQIHADLADAFRMGALITADKMLAVTGGYFTVKQDVQLLADEVPTFAAGSS